VPHIFVSYRREDCEAEARLVTQTLQAAFGESCVFFDREGIRGGERYPQVLRRQLAA